MQSIFKALSKIAFEYLFHNKTFSDEEISDVFSDVPSDFDGFGVLGMLSCEKVTGEGKDYFFLYKPIQELLAAIYLTTLTPQEQLRELREIFGNKAYEMVWVFYAGITTMHAISIDEILKEKLDLPQQHLNTDLPAKSLKHLIKAWENCHSYFMTMSDKFSVDFLLTLMLCCYEAKNEKACKAIAAHVYPDVVCRIEIPPNRVTPYLLLAVSYFISHSGKLWSLRCEASIQSGVELLFKYITASNYLDESSINGGIWVLCYVVKSSQIDAYCKAIKSQSSLQWIHLLNGSCLGDEGTIELCKHLTFDCPVIKAELEGCRIGGEGLKSIAHMLNINRKILHIDLRKNCFSLNDVQEFLLSIKKQLYLKCLLLDKDFCENPEIISILKELNSIRKKNNVEFLNVNHR